MNKELIVLERTNGWYGGYEIENGEYVQLFNTDAKTLFGSIKFYTDRGYSVTCVGKEQEDTIMKGKITLEQYLSEITYSGRLSEGDDKHV